MKTNASSSNNNPEALLYTIKETCALMSIGRTKCYELIQARKLKALRVGPAPGRRGAVRITRDSILEFIGGAN